MKKSRSISARMVRSTVLGCIAFGLIAQFAALSFYFFSLTKQYIETAHSTSKQAKMSATHTVDTIGYSDQIMEIYRGLSEEQRAKIGTEEYRGYFSGIDTTTKGGEYDVLFHIVNGVLESHTQNDIEDLYIAMYDKDTSAMVYIVDSDDDSSQMLLPGEWEAVNRKGMMKFLEPDNSELIFDIGWSEKYGLLCTVGEPIIEKGTGRIASFVLADISLNNIISGMAEFSLGFTIVIIIVTCIMAWLRTKLIKRDVVRPINLIAEASQRFADDRQNDSSNTDHFSDLDIHTGDEIENLCHTMANMETDIVEFGRNLLNITKEKERISTELSLAKKIQKGMLPNTYPAFPDRTEFDIYATMTPAKEVGGDFYDYFFIDDDHLALVIADVSGKGVPAALFMMISKLLINIYSRHSLSPAKVLEEINTRICQKNEQEMFVTVWLGILEVSTGKLTAANAGHEYPIMRKAGGDYELIKDKHGFVIGGIDGVKYTDYEITLEKGGSLFLYTDGAPEATNSDNTLFGTDRLIETLNRNKDCSPAELLNNVKSTIDEFVGSADQFDDLTMLGIMLK